MKKTALIITFALAVLFVQCKKKDVTQVNANNGNKIHVTLDAGYGGGNKTEFDPSTLLYNWNDGTTEYICVGGSVSGYLGEISGTGTGGSTTNRISFSGDITAPHPDETIYFFYLGNGSHAANPTTLDFSNQTTGTAESVGGFLVAANSGTLIDNGNGTFSASADLNILTSVACFDLEEAFGDEPVIMSGTSVCSRAVVDFTTGTIVGDGSASVSIDLGIAGDAKYVALIPTGDSETTMTFTSPTQTYEFTFPEGIQGATYYSDATTVGEVNGLTPTIVVDSNPVGAIRGKFSVSDDKQVYFSKGNLQFYRRVSYLVNGQPYWRFASQQYEIFGVTGHNQAFRDEFLAANYPSIGAANRDVFGWATSGWHDPNDDGNTNYEPWSIEFFSNGYTVANNTVGYGPSDGTKDITGEYANYDWGVYNSQEERHIYVDAGLTEATGSWRTLSLAEWNWVIGPDGTPGVNCRTASTVNGVENARFAKAYLNVTISANASNANDASRRIHGLILFPDTYVHPSDVALPTGINDKTNTSWNANEYTAEEWEKMENAGAVFLPAAGQRNGFTTLPDSSGPAQVAHVNENGFYWSTTHDPYELNQGGTIYPPCLAYCMQISSGSINTTNSGFSRNTGNAVRLVSDVEE